MKQGVAREPAFYLASARPRRAIKRPDRGVLTLNQNLDGAVLLWNPCAFSPLVKTACLASLFISNSTRQWVEAQY